MDDVKKLKDPVYGYISVDSDFIVEIIDTPGFQRLRDIIQTSYAPLYSSAVHNRFVHSIGVYHLGCIASEAIRQNCDKDISKWESKIIEQKQGEKSIIDTARMKESLKQIQIYKKWTDIFFEFADDQGIDRDFVIIPTNQFTSGFSKSDIGRLRIEFPGLKEPCDFAEVSNVLTSYSDPDESRFFYLFYYRKNPDDKIDVCALTSRLKQMAEECCA